jgi:hypothetical protein
VTGSDDRATYAYGDGGSITGPASVVASAIAFEQSERAKEQAWADDLIRRGVKAAHPDDGWVNREENTVTFAYPRFDHSPAAGDVIALGDPDKFRLVRVTDTRYWGVLCAMVTYSFDPLP